MCSASHKDNVVKPFSAQTARRERIGKLSAGSEKINAKTIITFFGYNLFGIKQLRG